MLVLNPLLPDPTNWGSGIRGAVVGSVEVGSGVVKNWGPAVFPQNIWLQATASLIKHKPWVLYGLLSSTITVWLLNGPEYKATPKVF